MPEIISNQRIKVPPIMPAGWGLWLWWVLASTVGWFVAMAGAGLGTWPGLGGWGGLGALYGATTGLWLVRLLREPAAAASAE